MIEKGNPSYLFVAGQVWSHSGKDHRVCVKIISMGECKKDISPFLTHWSYIFHALTHRYGSGVRLVCVISVIWGSDICGANCMEFQHLTVLYKTKFGSQNFGYQRWCLFYNICNVFKYIFNVPLIIIWLSIVVEGFFTTEIWALEILEGYQLW